MSPTLRSRLGFVVALGSSLICSTQVLSLQPPDPGELEQMRQTGTFDERLERATQLGNHRTDPRLVWNFKRSQMRAAGIGDAQIAAEIGNAPPPAWQGGLPATGTPKVFVLLVDFPDYPRGASHTRADIENKFFGDGDPTKVPYESLRNYYKRASYDQLTVQGTVFDWYRAQQNRSYYQGLGDGPGQEVLMKEAINYWNGQGHDFTQYDNDGDGTIDAFFIKWTGPDNGWSGFWWAYQWVWHSDTAFRVDGKRLGRYVWSWVARPTNTAYQAHVDIHETGHLLGLPDLYDYNGSEGPDGGVGDLDMMDANWGDHNCFSKYMLGWLSPTVVAAGSQVKDLGASGTSKDCVLMMPGATANTLFSEFFMAQYRKRSTGNDPADYPTDGLIIWHVDSTLTSNGQDFLYDNSYTDHKYMRLMEADGLEEIDQNGSADAGDFYLAPKTFGTSTTPNSRRYNNQVSGVTVDELGAPGATMSGRFRIVTGPDIYLASSTLTAETCPPGNDAIDPYETVTVSIELRNAGLGASTNLQATLLATGGVTAPSGAQTYGALQPNGAGVSRPFTFTANGSCGDTITLTLQLNDGANSLGTVSVTHDLGAIVSGLTERFDSVTAPALPAGWTANVAQGTASKWATRASSSDTPPNCIYSAAPASITDNLITSPAVTLASSSAKLRFRHKFDLESNYDGGVLEIAVGAGPFADILTAGGSFEAGGYNRTVATGYGNPLAGRQAWSGKQTSYGTVLVRLPAGLAGQSVKFRWRTGTDNMYSASGWYVDSIAVEDGFTCCDPYAIIVDKVTVAVPESGTATFQVKLASPPSGDKIVTVSKQAGGDDDLTIQSGASLTFNASNYNVFQTVTLAAADDADALDGQATFLCQAPDLHDATVLAIEDDDNSYDLRVTPETVIVPENGTATFQLKLGAEPASDVVVSVARVSGDADITVDSGATLTFTPANWDVYQTVTLAAAEDEDAADMQATILCSAPDWPDLSVTAVEDDNDTLAMELSTTALSIAETGLATFQLRLTAAPVNPLTVSVSRASGDTSVKVKVGSALRFAPGNYTVWQTVTLQADNDPDAANGTSVIRCSGAGMQAKTVDVTEIDDDTMEIILPTTSLLVPEGFTGGFPLRLGAQPLDDTYVTVTITGDPDLTILAGASVKFTPADWDIFKTVTLTAAQDDDINAGQATVRLNAPGMLERTLTAQEADDDALAIVPSAGEISVGEMQTASFTVKLAAIPNGSVPVTVEMVPGDADITLQSAATLQFEPATWNVPQQVIVAAARDLDTLNGESRVRLSGAGLESVEVVVTELDDGIVPPTWYADGDGDGFGNPDSSVPAWTQPGGYTADSSDCDDARISVHPGAAEVCDNSVDDNCDGTIDEGCYVPPPPPADSDGDNVTDDLDACPNTPAGTTVGANGCPPPPPVNTDTDGDGVIDSQDACPGTPAGTTVGANGCPANPPVGTDADADGDGVPDATDQCPGTPGGTTVGANGCPISSGQNDDDDQADQPTPPGGDGDQNIDTPPVPPACATGLAESVFGIALGLALIQRRRR